MSEIEISLCACISASHPLKEEHYPLNPFLEEQLKLKWNRSCPQI